MVAAKQILNNLYGLMLEINFHKADEVILVELKTAPDPQIDEHLLKIRQLTAKLKAESNRQKFNSVVEQVRLLRQNGIDELKKLILPQEQAEMIPLFHKFEQLTEGDEASILEDQQMLYLMEILKNRMNDTSSN